MGMNRRFIVEKIKEMQEKRIAQLKKNERVILKMPFQRRELYRIKHVYRMKEVKKFGKMLMNFFGSTQEFKNKKEYE